MDTDASRTRLDALAFLRRHKTGVLATTDTDSRARARLIYYVCDDSFNIFFATLSSTRKYQDILSNPYASFVVATEDVPQTIQIEGMASQITEGEKAVEGMSELIDTLMSNSTFYWPVLKLHPGEVVVMKFTPQLVRWADYAFGESGQEHVFKEIPIQ
jgi:general stress protein 26